MRLQLIKYMVTEFIINGRSTIPVYHNNDLVLMDRGQVLGLILGRWNLFVGTRLTTRY